MKNTLLALLLFLGILSLPAAAGASPETPASEDAQFTAAAVFELFENKCIDCHGAHLAKPKGKFGYVMDLKRVAANPDYVVPGNPGKSELFRTVDEDEMPGKNSKCGPATVAEKLALRHWIQIGAPASLPEKLLARQKQLTAPGAENQAAKKPVEATDSFLAKLLRWIGNFHAASTHFPIGLLVAAVLSEALALWSRKEVWLSCTRFLVLVGTAGALGTATLGWLNAHPGVTALYQFHKWLGTGSAVWALLCAGCAVFFECKEGSPERNRLRGALLIGALIISVTGFLGGAITYGLEHYKW